jgi:hypothetical protein
VASVRRYPDGRHDSETGLPRSAADAATTPGMLEAIAVAPAIFVNSLRVISSGSLREFFKCLGP